MIRGLYILDMHGNPLAVETIEIWLDWRATCYEDRIVARTEIAQQICVSTVFLGIDHSFGSADTPILYESMTRGGATSQDQERYATKEQALVGHAAMVVAAQTANGVQG